ncbi:MAG: Ig-like domain repeat protein, partial [Acidobacteriota bacterium]|nr:Ig-like domain repeat protein [Acidobacteriota bacterium]
ADSATVMPGQSTTKFGSTAPPSAADGKVVFTGWDNESAPTVGGIYLADLSPSPALTTLVSIGDQVPGQADGTTFSNFGEGLSFDGRYVGFWASWGGNKADGVALSCPTDGNDAIKTYCAEHDNGYVAPVPAHQGIFVYDTSASTNPLIPVATDDSRFSGFQYWVYSGMPPGQGSDDASMELPHWRVSAFVAVSGLSGNNGYQVAFKASTTDGATGIYLGQGPSSPRVIAALRTGDLGSQLDHDPLIPTGLVVTSVGLERDGFRNGNLVINASFLQVVTAPTVPTDEATEPVGWAGIYFTRVPNSLAMEDQTITFPPVPTAYPSDSFELTALASSGYPVNLSVDSASTDYCSVSGSTVTYLKVGLCTILATSSGDASYYAGSDSLPITIVPRPQTITFPTVPPAYLGETYDLGATSDSNLPISYSTVPTDSTVCSIDASTVSYNAEGTCTILAAQSGNDNYLPAETKTQEFLVTLHPQLISFAAPPSVVYLGSTYTLRASSDSGLDVSYSQGATTPSGACSLTPAASNSVLVRFLATGTCVVNIDQAGTTTVAPAPTRSVTFSVVTLPPVISAPPPTPQVITVPPPPAVTVGSTYTIPATTDSGLPLTYAVDSSSSSGVCAVSGSTVTFASVGTCVVNISQPGDTTHEAALAVQKITVGAMSTSVVLAPSTSTLRYGQTGRANAKVSFAVGTASGTVQFSLDGRALGAALPVVNGTVLSPALRDVGNRPLRPGTHTVTAVFTPSDVARYASASATAKYVVKKASTTLSVVVRPSLISATAVTVKPGVATATGTVTFKLSGKVIGRAVLHNRVATLRYVVKAGQARLITASYSGNAYLLGSNSSPSTAKEAR